MGLEIKKKGTKYQLISTISDERLHEKAWITEDEAKVCLIHQRLHEFVEKVIEIDMTFPHRYNVNGVYHRDATKPNFNQFMLDAFDNENCDEIITNKFTEVYNRLKLEFKIP